MNRAAICASPELLSLWEGKEEKELPDGMMSKQDNRIEPQRYYELFEKDTIKFGNSSREYNAVFSTVFQWLLGVFVRWVLPGLAYEFMFSAVKECGVINPSLFALLSSLARVLVRPCETGFTV
ncbi:hypothetical protein ACLOJK_039532 [Asimina triloba]